MVRQCSFNGSISLDCGSEQEFISLVGCNLFFTFKVNSLLAEDVDMSDPPFFRE